MVVGEEAEEEAEEEVKILVITRVVDKMGAVRIVMQAVRVQVSVEIVVTHHAVRPLIQEQLQVFC